VSKTTARCDGFCFFITSINEFANPNTADVSSPFEFILGFFAKAK